MNIPKAVADLVAAQDNFDSVAYANCFSETATVEDEGVTYNGRVEIASWIDNANRQFKTIMKPIEFSKTVNILKAEISGDFPGSPLVLNYHFKFADELIQSLQISS